MFVLAGTGSRSCPPTVIDSLVHIITRMKTKHPDCLIVSGGAEGFDYWLTLAARKCDVPYQLCIPNHGYGAYYWKDDMDSWNEMLDLAIHVEYTMEDVYASNELYLNGEHSNLVRNRRMIEIANGFVVYDPTSKGTRHCFELLRKKRLPYEIVS